MGGDVQTIKERLDIAEIIGGYVKLEKSGGSYKGRCPFHNEKTPSFYVSPTRQSYYCFGCGVKGDIFTFVEEMEGLSFREALKQLAEKAGVEVNYRPEAKEVKDEKEQIKLSLDIAREFFEGELEKSDEAKKYLKSRGISDDSIKSWKLGYAPAEWRGLYSYLLSKGFTKNVLVKAGLIKLVDGADKEPYDVFRDRVIFPLSDASGQVVAFSGRALAKETEPKYLNSPDTVLFTKSDLLYGLDKAKEKIRRQDYAILVEGQMDLVLSHQAGVENTVASSGTAFTHQHLERLKRLSKRIILAFDGDNAGEKAAEKAATLALSLGLEVKIAKLPEGEDPAELVKKDPDLWKRVLKDAKSAIEHFLLEAVKEEKDRRKLGKLIEKKILPLLVLLESSIERSHFVSLIAKNTGIKEDVIWDDLRKIKIAPIERKSTPVVESHGMTFKAVTVDSQDMTINSSQQATRKEKVEERLTEVRMWLKEVKDKDEVDKLKKEEAELVSHLEEDKLKSELHELSVSLGQAETSKEEGTIEELTKRIQEIHKELRALENSKKIL